MCQYVIQKKVETSTEIASVDYYSLLIIFTYIKLLNIYIHKLSMYKISI